MKIEIHENIRKLRVFNNLSQQQMAIELNLSVGAYSNMENGKAEVTFRRLEEIANVLGITVIDLITANCKINESLTINSLQYLYEQIIERDRKIIETLEQQIMDLKNHIEIIKNK